MTDKKSDNFVLPENLTFEVIFVDTPISVDGREITVGDFYNEVVGAEKDPNFQMTPCMRKDDIIGGTEAEKKEIQELIKKIEQCTTDKQPDPKEPEVLTLRRSEIVGNPQKHLGANGKIELEVGKEQRILGVILPHSKHVLLWDRFVSSHKREDSRHKLTQITCERIRDSRYALFAKGLKDYRQACLSGEIAKLTQEKAVEVIELLETKHKKKPIVDNIIEMIELLNDSTKCNADDRKQFTDDITKEMAKFSPEDWQTLFHQLSEKKEMNLLRDFAEKIPDNKVKRICNKMLTYYDEYEKSKKDIGYDKDAPLDERNTKAVKVNKKYNLMRGKMDSLMNNSK